VSRLFIILVVAAISISTGVVVWMSADRGRSGEEIAAPAMPTPDPNAEGGKHRENFFGGDPNRDVRSGQEMKPRW
jgi:Ti type entry exclusion protein TrbK